MTHGRVFSSFFYHRILTEALVCIYAPGRYALLPPPLSLSLSVCLVRSCVRPTMSGIKLVLVSLSSIAYIAYSLVFHQHVRRFGLLMELARTFSFLNWLTLLRLRCVCVCVCVLFARRFFQIPEGDEEVGDGKAKGR